MTQMVTSYGAAKIATQYIQNLGSTKSIRPQMVYNYVKKGYIPSTDGQIDVSDLMVWIKKYCEKNVTVDQPTLF